MGRAMLIICAGVLVALGYTFIGSASQSESMIQRNVNTYYSTKAKNVAHTGIQIAIERYNNDATNDPTQKEQEFTYTESTEGTDLNLTLKEDVETIGKNNTEIAKVTSKSTYNGAEHTVISTFDISKKQQLVPIFAGALSKVGDQDVNFEKGNPKVHFNGNAPAGSGCDNKPGFTVNDQEEVDDYDDSSNIEGDPDVAVDNSIEVDDVSDLVDALEPQATTIGDGFDWATSTEQNPGVYFLEGEANYSGKDNGYGILVVRNNATLNILSVSGQFTFNGLVIFENGGSFKGTGNATFNGSVVSVSDSYSTFDINANGNFTAQYDCNSQKYANDAVFDVLNTTIYKQLSVYE